MACLGGLVTGYHLERKAIDLAVLLAHNISNPPLSCSGCQTVVHPVCSLGIHGHRRGLRKGRFGLLVWEGSCGRTVLLKARTAGCTARSTAGKAVVVATIEGSQAAVAAMMGAVEVYNSRSVP
jgi:hypothetical protein